MTKAEKAYMRAYLVKEYIKIAEKSPFPEHTEYHFTELLDSTRQLWLDTERQRALHKGH